MSKVIAFHTSKNSLRRFVEDIHGDSEYSSLVIDSINSLWSKFSLNMHNPYNVALCNVMHCLSKHFLKSSDVDEFYDEIIEEVEDSFYSCDAVDELGDSDAVVELFYLFCPLLMDYLIEEAQIDEIEEYNIEFITIYRDRIDITF